MVSDGGGMNGKKKKPLDKTRKVFIIIYDERGEYRIELRKKYSGKILLGFDKGIFRSGKREDSFLASEVNRSLKTTPPVD